ncbi:hypothetical protein ACQKND_17625 [Viridibacillus arvi]|uniref:hypothetical protein n=1 Tax=Viridibacillus arvi TaxID=263475 RepID=UPI003D087D56
MAKERGEIWVYKKNYNNESELGVIVGSTGESILKIDMLNSIAEINQDLGTYDIVLENWEEIGLEKPSVVRLKFSEITDEDLISKVATLDKKDINRISQSIIKYFSA